MPTEVNCSEIALVISWIIMNGPAHETKLDHRLTDRGEQSDTTQCGLLLWRSHNNHAVFHDHPR